MYPRDGINEQAQKAADLSGEWTCLSNQVGAIRLMMIERVEEEIVRALMDHGFPGVIAEWQQRTAYDSQKMAVYGLASAIVDWELWRAREECQGR